MRKMFLISLLGIIFGCKNSSKETTAISQQDFSPELKESISRGAQQYNNFCASCHLSNGEGIKGVFPPLANSNWLKDKREESIHAIKFGLNGPITVNGEKYDNLMPALGLNDSEIADIMNYINSSWGNILKEPVTAEEVKTIKK